MRGRQIAVCCEEEGYVRRFTDYANGQKDSLFTVHGFTGVRDLAAYTKEHPAEILLISEELWRDYTGALEAGEIFLLTEGDYQQEGEPPGICRYQSCREILRNALNLYAERTQTDSGLAVRTDKMKKLGVYSPIGRSGKTSFAMALGREIGKKKRTLYLNLEEYSGFASLYPYGDGGTLSELMYFLKQGKKAFACKLEGMTQEINGVECILPVRSPVELRHIRKEDWEQLLDMLEKESRCEAVILDLGGTVNGLFELLDACDWIYTPTEQEETAKAKFGQYEDTLKILELDEVMKRTTVLEASGREELLELAEKEGRRWTQP